MVHAMQSNIDFLENIIAADGPKPENYAFLVETFSRLHAMCYREVDGLSEMTQPIQALEAFFARHADIFRDVKTMQGYAYAKPRGYAGDFEMIERIYDKVTASQEHLVRWDRFFHMGAAPKAVRNRAGYIFDLLKDGGYESMLSLGCGSGRDLARTNDETVLKRMTLVDADADAIRKARVNLTNPEVEYTFLHKNVFRLKLEERFDIVWSAGLFDYLNTRRAVFLLERVREMMAEGGKIVIGNFSKDNPSRAYMEIVGEWMLIHRTREEMADMMVQAGFDPAKVTVDSDETGVNLFAIAEK